MFKKIIGIVGAVIAVVTAFIFGSKINRRGIPGSDGILDNIGDSIKEAGRVNQESGSAITTAQSIAGDIKRDNKDAAGGIRTAKDILKRAKERSDAQAD